MMSDLIKNLTMVLFSYVFAATLYIYIYIFFFFIISDFLPFSPNLVANHTPISSITPPCYLDPPHTPRPWRPQLGSSDPESDTPSPSRILSSV